MMDLDKIGKFIGELRKQRNLTQLELGKRLNISDKSVSKWERGLNAPDISILNELSTILGVTTTELLNGERDNKEISIESIQFYNKRSKRKYRKYFIGILLVIIFLFSVFFIANNSNRFQVYSISSQKENCVVNGYIIFNKNRNIGFINKIEYVSEQMGTEEDLLIKDLNILLKNDEEILYSATYDLDELTSLSNSLIGKNLYIEDYIEKDEKILNSSLEKLAIELIYIDQNDMEGSLVIPLSFMKIDSGITWNH